MCSGRVRHRVYHSFLSVRCNLCAIFCGLAVGVGGWELGVEHKLSALLRSGSRAAFEGRVDLFQLPIDFAAGVAADFIADMRRFSTTSSVTGCFLKFSISYFTTTS